LANRLPCWAGGAGYRDRPIIFQWRSPPDLVATLGLPPAGNAAHEATRSMILAEALLGAHTGQAVSYSRRKVFYATGRKYRSPAYTYATVMKSVAELVQQGWLFEHRVRPNHRGWQSSFWATPDLIQAARAFDAELIFDPGEPIRLKDMEGDLVDYPDTRETLRLRRALEPINAYLKGLRIELPGAVHQGRHLRIGDVLILPRERTASDLQSTKFWTPRSGLWLVAKHPEERSRRSAD
jgi:hypothetical protein